MSLEIYLYFGSVQEPKRRTSQSRVLWKQDKDTLLVPKPVYYSIGSSLSVGTWFQLCLNGKYICNSKRLLTDQLFLPAVRFVFKGKPHFAFLSSPTTLLQVQKDCSTCQGSDLFSTSWQEGAGCHRSWCLPLYYTTCNTDTLLFWIIFPSQHMLSEKLCNTADLTSTLFTRCFASIASAISNVDQELKAETHKQLHNRPSPTLSLHHIRAALRCLWTRSHRQELQSNPPPETLHGEDWLSGLRLTSGSHRKRVFEEVPGGGMSREIHCRKQLFSWLKKKKKIQLCFGTFEQALKLIDFCLLHPAVVHCFTIADIVLETGCTCSYCTQQHGPFSKSCGHCYNINVQTQSNYFWLH